MPRSYLRLFQAIITLFIICAFVGGLIGAVNALTADRIFDLKLQKTENAMRTVMPSGNIFNEIGDVSGYNFDSSVSAFYEALDSNNTCIGYCVEAKPNGFASQITVLVGLSFDGTVQGVVITDCTGETPGLGNRVAEPGFTSQFNGKGSTLAFSTGGAPASNEVSAISGATYSSRGVYEGVSSCIRAAISYTSANGGEAK